ncbi:MAG: SDR family oxidoreductase [Chloroflexi bacterium]|nr:SDR family oxidoreductase [Chloroflexota bacterium]
MKLQGKVAIVTGAAQGIGEAYAHALAGEGAAVVVADINVAKGKSVADSINRAGTGGKATCLKLDVADEKSCAELVAQAEQLYGGVDILVNNAAIYHSMRMDTLMNVPLDYYNRFMAVNLTGQMLMTRAAVPAMRKRGKGKIVFQASAVAYSASSTPYAIAKLGIVGMMRGFAFQLGKHNINVNGIAPGPIDTEATMVTVPKHFIDHLLESQPLRRMGHPSDLVGALVYLCSSESDYVTGLMMVVDGGNTVSRL